GMGGNEVEFRRSTISLEPMAQHAGNRRHRLTLPHRLQLFLQSTVLAPKIGQLDTRKNLPARCGL
ncbi:MAG: hypothetical protein AAF844_15360, partial [Pseudomonadota bacterium]